MTGARGPPPLQEEQELREKVLADSSSCEDRGAPSPVTLMAPPPPMWARLPEKLLSATATAQGSRRARARAPPEAASFSRNWTPRSHTGITAESGVGYRGRGNWDWGERATERAPPRDPAGLRREGGWERRRGPEEWRAPPSPAEEQNWKTEEEREAATRGEEERAPPEEREAEESKRTRSRSSEAGAEGEKSRAPPGAAERQERKLALEADSSSTAPSTARQPPPEGEKPRKKSTLEKEAAPAPDSRRMKLLLPPS